MSSPTTLLAPRRHTAFLAALLALVLLLVMADCERDPGPYNPTPGDTIWHRTSATVPQRILILGDSILASSEIPVPADRFDARLVEALSISPARVANGAVSGLTLVGAHPNLVDRAPALLAALSPGGVVVIDIGMNDACGALPLATFTAAYATLLTQIQTLGLHVLVGLVTPVMPALWACETERQQIDSWLSATYPDTVIDYPAVLRATTGWIEPRKATEDGKHPDEGGTAEIADATAAALRGRSWWVGVRVIG
jgi:lysophospholipase L1-like esterase